MSPAPASDPGARPTSLDHVVVVVSDLDSAVDRAAALLARLPTWRGEHPGAGTANALFPLANTYLELLAPRGEGPLGAHLAGRLAEAGEGVFALAFGVADAEAFSRARGGGEEPRDGSGVEAGGAERRWRTVGLALDASRGVPVFAIEHREGELTASPVCGDPDAAVEALDHVVVLSGDLEASRAFYADDLGLRLALDRTFPKRRQRILFFRVGGATVEVVGPADPGAVRGEPDRLWGLAWRVRDVAAARARIDAAGIDVSPVRAGAKPGTDVFSVRGEPLGVPTLVIGPAEETAEAMR